MTTFTKHMVAGTALSLLMAGAPAALAAPGGFVEPGIDRIVTGTGQQLAQLGTTAGEPVEEDNTQRRKRREQRGAEQQGEQPQGAAEQQAGEQPRQKRRELQAEQPQDEGRPRRERQRQAEQQPAEAEKPTAEQPRQKRRELQAERPQGEGQQRRERQRQAEQQPAETEKPAETQAEQPRKKRGEQQAEQPATVPADKPVEQAAPVPADKPVRAAEPEAKPDDKPRRKREQQAEQPAEPARPPVNQAQPATPPIGQPQTAEPAEQPADKPQQEAQPTAPAGQTDPQQARPAEPAIGGETPRQAQPGTEALPENAAPVLDSQKPRRDRDGKRRPPEAEQATRPVVPPAEAGPPPASDAAAQVDPIRRDQIRPVTEEQGRRVERERQPRRERRDGVDVLREIGDRVIVELGNQIIVESTDRPRMTRGARDVYYEDLPRGRTRETVVRPNGVEIVTIRDRYGDVIRRSRIMPDGREYVLVYVDEERRGPRDGRWRDPGLDLPPLQLTIPVHDYILDAERVSDPDEYYDFFEQPPVERIQRTYSIDEVKRSARVRDSVRRIDLDTITFEFGSAEISESQVGRLEGVANAMQRILEQNPAETFLIEGHTDAVGSDMANLALSDRRAEAVADALSNVFDIPPENLTTQGYGEQYLKIDSQSPERENRRVAMRRITPLVAPVASAN